MEVAMSTNTAVGLESRVLNEGYGSGAWHGPDLKAALADVTAELAYWRPGPGRHNIAEIGLHHAYFVRAVRTQISGQSAEPFVVAGEDWFDLESERTLAWPKVQSTVEAAHRSLAAVLSDIEVGRQSPLTEAERFGLVLGITCHAVYHAGQIQLIKRLREQLK
jgi:hypothetical protein